MPRIKTILCSGIGILYVTALIAQVAPPKYKTFSNVVEYQIHQQKQWNYNQLSKNSIQYRSDPKYIPFRDHKVLGAGSHSYPLATPEVKKSFLVSSPALNNNGKSYLQSSRFLKYEWQRQPLQNRLGHSL